MKRMLPDHCMPKTFGSESFEEVIHVLHLNIIQVRYLSGRRVEKANVKLRPAYFFLQLSTNNTPFIHDLNITNGQC